MSLADFKSAWAASAIIHHQPTGFRRGPSFILVLCSLLCECVCVCVIELRGPRDSHLQSFALWVSWNPGRHSQEMPPFCVSLQMCAQPWFLSMQVGPSLAPSALTAEEMERGALKTGTVFSQETHGMSQMDESKSVKMPDVRFLTSSHFYASRW